MIIVTESHKNILARKKAKGQKDSQIKQSMCKSQQFYIWSARFIHKLFVCNRIAYFYVYTYVEYIKMYYNTVSWEGIVAKI